MAKLSKRTSSCLIFTNLWTFPAYHMDASKEKNYGNTYTWPAHFREPKNLKYSSSPGHSSYVFFILFQRGSPAGWGFWNHLSCQLIFWPFLSLRLTLINLCQYFFLNFIFFHFPFKNISNSYIN